MLLYFSLNSYLNLLDYIWRKIEHGPVKTLSTETVLLCQKITSGQYWFFNTPGEALLSDSPVIKDKTNLVVK